jgi:hypothetical protein
MSKSSKAEKLASQATFIFKGTVKRLKAATIPSLPVTEKTAVVRVDEILRASEALQHFAGTDITVLLDSRENFGKGERALFYTTSWMLGESLAVVSLGHTPVSGDSAAATDSTLSSSDETIQRLQKKVVDADTVVTGRVTNVRLARASLPTKGRAKKSGRDEYGPISEHDPIWQEAVIEVSDVEKGRGTQKRILVRFPESTDVMWVDTPKLQLGQEGVFLLKNEKGQRKSAARSGSVPASKLATPAQKVYTALDSEAVQPIQKVEAIRSIIKTTKR